MSDSSLGSSYILLFNLCNNPVSQGLLFSPSSFQRVNWATQRGNLICLDCSMPGLRVHYQLPEFTQTHVHRVSDAIQPRSNYHVSESEVAQSCPTLCDPMDSGLHQAPPSMGFSRQEYWSGVPLPSLY